MKFFRLLFLCFLILSLNIFGQSVSFSTFMNPVIPGDHSDCTLTQVGNDFYTTGSSFNPTPVIYHSTDLVHWEAVAQPVSAAWSGYGDAPAGGCWGGQVVFYNGKWWDFFKSNSGMCFVSADSVKGPWSMPTVMNTPASVPGLGYDNSIFIDDDGSWYLVVKNGQPNNWIVQLGNNGQPSGKVLNLTWINPGPSYAYSWAEGPVMWKHDGYYYYAFARDVSGGEYVMSSKTLTDSESAWTKPIAFFNTTDPLASSAVFQNPNHCSAVVTLSDSTYWILHPLWRSGNNNEWYGQGRQGLLNEVVYNANGMPVAGYPVNVSKPAPKLPSSGIPWMAPHADFFTSSKLNPEWSFLGFTPANSYSLTNRPGWLWLAPKTGKPNTIIKNDGEHNYSLITRVDFNPKVTADEAGLWIFNGNQTTYAKLFSTVDSTGSKEIVFSYDKYTFANSNTAGDTVWLKLVREEHKLTGYWSADGFNWNDIGSVDASGMDGLQPNYNSWTGNRQGLFVQNSPAYFNFYIYRDAYTSILAECPANQYGTTSTILGNGNVYLDNISNNDWALYGGVEFGNSIYQRTPDSLQITAASGASGGTVEVYIDSIDASTKIAECNIPGTGSWSTFDTFTTNLMKPVTDCHDVYLKFTGTGSSKLLEVKSFQFITHSIPASVGELQESKPEEFYLFQNYPNPFNPSTVIRYEIPKAAYVTLIVYDILGRQVATLVNKYLQAGIYSNEYGEGSSGSDYQSRSESGSGSMLASGVYLYRLSAGSFSGIKKMVYLK